MPRARSAATLALACIALTATLTGCSPKPSKLDDAQIHKTLDARKVHGQPLFNDLAATVNPFEYPSDPAADHRPCADRKFPDDARLGPEQKAMEAAGLLTFASTGDCAWTAAYTPLAQADLRHSGQASSDPTQPGTPQPGVQPGPTQPEAQPGPTSTVVLSRLSSYEASDVQQTGNDATATLTIRYTLTPSGTAYAKSGFPFPHNATACTLDPTAHTDTCTRPIKFRYASSHEGWNAEM